ncbi:hypothetical protein N2152v2_003720 [Parachlorella kessleri]
MVTDDCSSGRHEAESVAGSAAQAAPRRRQAPAATGSKGSCGEVSSAVRQPHHTSSEDTLSYEPSISDTGDVEPEELPDGQLGVAVVVGTTKGVYLVQKNKVLYNGEEIAPTVFEATGGKANTRKWRSTLRVLLPDGTAGKRLGVWLWDHGFYTWALPAKRKRSADQDGRSQGQQQQQGSQAQRCSAAASRCSSLPSSPTKGPPSPTKSYRAPADSLPSSPGGCPRCSGCRAAASAATAPKPQPAPACGGYPGRPAGSINHPHTSQQHQQRATGVAAEAKAFLASLPPSAQAVLGPPPLLASGRPPYYPFWPLPPVPQQAYEGAAPTPPHAFGAGPPPPPAQVQWLLRPPATQGPLGPAPLLFPPAGTGNPTWQRQQGPSSPVRPAPTSVPGSNPVWSPLSSLRSTFSRLAGQAQAQPAPPASPGAAAPAGPARAIQQAGQPQQQQQPSWRQAAQQQSLPAQQAAQHRQDEAEQPPGDAAHYMLADVPPVLPKHKEHRRPAEQRRRRQQQAQQPLGSVGSGPSTAGMALELEEVDLSECTPVLPEEAGWHGPTGSFGRGLVPGPAPLAAAPTAAARQQQAALAALGPLPAFPAPGLALPVLAVPAAANLRQPLSRSPSPPVHSPPSPLSPPPGSPAVADLMDLGDCAAIAGRAVRQQAQHGQPQQQQPGGGVSTGGRGSVGGGEGASPRQWQETVGRVAAAAGAAPHAAAHHSGASALAAPAMGTSMVGAAAAAEGGIDELDLDWLIQEGDLDLAALLAQDSPQQPHPAEQQGRHPQQPEQRSAQEERQQRGPQQDLAREANRIPPPLSLQQVALTSSAVVGPMLPGAMDSQSGRAAAAPHPGDAPGQGANGEGACPPSAAAGADSEADLLAELLSTILPSPRDAAPCAPLPAAAVPAGNSLPAPSAPTVRQLPAPQHARHAAQQGNAGAQQARQAQLAVVELWPFDVECEADHAAAATAAAALGDRDCLATPAAAGVQERSPRSDQGSGKRQPLPTSGSAFDLQVYAGMGLPSPDDAAIKCLDSGLAFSHSPGPSFWLTSP